MAIERPPISKGLYQRVYYSRVEAVISACQTVDALSHSGEKGRIREILIRELFRPFLPTDIRIGTGFIVSSDVKKESAQQDIVLYDHSIVPPALFDEATGLSPIESVLYTVEVKSKVTCEEWKTSHASAKQIQQEMPLLGKDGKPSPDVRRPLSVLFALATDLSETGKSEPTRYDEVRGEDPPFISVICVVGRGYWYWEQKQGAWTEWREKTRLAEVVALLGGIMNTLPGLWETRRSMRPPVGAYLIDFGADLSALGRELRIYLEEFAANLVRGPDGLPELRLLQNKLAAFREKAMEIVAGYSGDEIKELFARLDDLASRLEDEIEHRAGSRRWRDDAVAQQDDEADDGSP